MEEEDMPTCSYICYANSATDPTLTIDSTSLAVNMRNKNHIKIFRLYKDSF